MSHKPTQYRLMVMLTTDDVDKAFAVRDKVQHMLAQEEAAGQLPENTEAFVSEPFVLCKRAPE